MSDVLEILSIVSLIVVAIVIGGVGYLLVWGLLRAGHLRPSVALVIALSILTMVSIIGFIVTQTSGQQSTELATLAGMGLGGLAGAVTTVWGDDRAESLQHDLAIEREKNGSVEASQTSDSALFPDVAGSVPDDDHEMMFDDEGDPDDALILEDEEKADG